eukprot:3934129-Rhodomonas_salina.2
MSISCVSTPSPRTLFHAPSTAESPKPAREFARAAFHRTRSDEDGGVSASGKKGDGNAKAMWRQERKGKREARLVADHYEVDDLDFLRVV